MISIKLTGLDDLAKNFRTAGDALEREVNIAFSKGIAMAGTESQRRTPVDTGNLKSSIGGNSGYRFVKGLTAGIGTNLQYAIYVHEGRGRHKVGERKFMETGLEEAKPYILEEFDKALGRVADHLASQ